MFKFVQRFIEKTSNLLFGDYVKQRDESYEELLAALDRKRGETPSEEKKVLSLEEARKIKREFFIKALQGGVASVYLDPRIRGVKVPERFRNQVPLVLNYSYRYHLADFDFEGGSIVASLSFGGVPFQCVIPWDAVMGIGNQGESTFYAFSGEPPELPDSGSLNRVESENPEFDEVSHERALERRKQFKVIKGGDSES